MKKFVVPGILKFSKSSIICAEGAGLRLIFNACDVSGNYKSISSKAISKRWKQAQDDYRSWFVSRQNFKVGNIMSVAVASDVWVINALYDGVDNKVAITNCLKKTQELAKSEKGSIHFSKLLFEEIPYLPELVNEYLVDEGLNVIIYEGDIKPA